MALFDENDLFNANHYRDINKQESMLPKILLDLFQLMSKEQVKECLPYVTTSENILNGAMDEQQKQQLNDYIDSIIGMKLSEESAVIAEEPAGSIDWKEDPITSGISESTTSTEAGDIERETVPASAIETQILTKTK